MKIIATLGDGEGSSYFRVRLPADTARAQGVDIHTIGSVPLKERVTTAPDGTRLRDVVEVQLDCDVLIVQRPITQVLAGIVVQAKRQGMGVVVEVDDHFGALHERSYARANMTQQQNPTWLHAACEAADVVTVTTPVLAGEYGYGKAQVIPNYLPRSADQYRHDGTFGTQLGWSGSTFTHHDDLPMARGAVFGNDRTVNVVGYEDGVADDLGIDRSRVRATSWVHGIEAYWEALGTSMDVGLVPLHLGTFNQAKSTLTGVTYATLGIPFIASPTDPYRRLAAHGVGTLADRRGGWARAVARLSGPDQWRASRDAGLEWASVNHIEDHMLDWARAWQTAWQQARRRKALGASREVR